MIKLQVAGTFEGYEESKTWPGKFYVYVRSVAQAPKGLLQTTRIARPYG